MVRSDHLLSIQYVSRYKSASFDHHLIDISDCYSTAENHNTVCIRKSAPEYPDSSDPKGSLSGAVVLRMMFLGCNHRESPIFSRARPSRCDLLGVRFPRSMIVFRA